VNASINSSGQLTIDGGANTLSFSNVTGSALSGLGITPPSATTVTSTGTEAPQNVPTGTITINDGTSNISVPISSSDPLSVIAANINAASGNTSIAASVVNDQLQITGAGTLTLGDSGGGQLAALGLNATPDASTITGTATEAATDRSGSFSINGGGVVNVADTDTLSDIAAAINGAAGGTGVTASINGSGQLVIDGGTSPVTFSGVTGNVLDGLGVDTGQTVTGTSALEPALGLAGSFTIEGGSQPVTVTVAATDSVSSIIDNINSAAAAAGSSVSASVGSGGQLQISSGSGALSFANVSGNALSGLGFSTSGAINQGTAPQAAQLTVDGVSGITRNSNTISDLLNGVTLNLAQASPSTTVTLGITPDVSGVTSAINAFVTAYNNWEAFVQQNEATSSSGGAAAGAVLFGDSSLRDASLEVDNAITQSINGTALADIGITLDNNNNLNVNTTTLSSALANNFASVNGFFQSELTTSAYTLQPIGTDFSSFNGSFQLGISMSGGTISGLTLNGGDASGDFTFSGNTITGVSGSPYAGMSFSYTGSGETVTVTSTQGMGNQVYTAADNYADPISGSLQNLIANIQSQDTSLTSQYNSIIDEANSYTNFLLTQYSALTTQIQTAGQTSDTLQALFNASNGSSSQL
jgi:flagellar hook-associated protein 2